MAAHDHPSQFTRYTRPRSAAPARTGRPEEQLEVRVGMEFDHRRWLSADGRGHMRFRVTRIERGVFHYRPVDGGGAEYCPLDEAYKVIDGWL